MPINSAITIAGIGTARATRGAAATAAIATSAESAKPGKTLRVACILLNRAEGSFRKADSGDLAPDARRNAVNN
jgi:hypothetical protein